MEGENIFGKHETVGIAENCVGLAENEYYEKLVPRRGSHQTDEIKADIVSGKIVVKSAYGMSQDELNAFKMPNSFPCTKTNGFHAARAKAAENRFSVSIPSNSTT